MVAFFKKMNTDEWVLVVQNSACFTYQILDETTTRKREPRWLRLAKRVIAFGCNLYGIRQLL